MLAEVRRLLHEKATPSRACRSCIVSWAPSASLVGQPQVPASCFASLAAIPAGALSPETRQRLSETLDVLMAVKARLDEWPGDG